jgi:hypothetical protein
VDDLLSSLKPNLVDKAETSSRVRQRIVLGYATSKGQRIGDNPARWRGHLTTCCPGPRRSSPCSIILHWTGDQSVLARRRRIPESSSKQLWPIRSSIKPNPPMPEAPCSQRGASLKNEWTALATGKCTI